MFAAVVCLGMGSAASAHAYPPVAINGESAINVTSTDATLEAQINPLDPEIGAFFQFQVVSNPSEYLPSFACPAGKFPDGTSLCLGLLSQVGALPFSLTEPGLTDQSLNLDLAKAEMALQPGTKYHYRVIAARRIFTVDHFEWEAPIIYGPDQTFSTSPLERPTVVIATPPEGASYTLGQTVSASYSCAAGAGAVLKSCGGPVETGAPINTASAGGQSFTVTAIDTDGQEVSVTHKYTVTRRPTALVALPQLVLFPPPHGVGLGRVSATLDSAGTPVTGRLVSFSVGDTALCSATTGLTGAASCRTSFAGELAVLLANRYAASFSGDSDYTGASAAAPAYELGTWRRR